jgi:competence protein ComEA
MLKKLMMLVLGLLCAGAFAAVDANKATQAELEAIKGIGPVIAGKILDERKKGSFKDWDDMIERVKGVGEGNAAKFSAEGLTVGGATYKGAAPKKDDKPAAKATTATTSPTATPATAPTAPATTAAPAAANTKADTAKADPKKEAAEAKAKAKADKKAKADADKKAKAEAKEKAKAEKAAKASDKPKAADSGASAVAAKK